MLKRLLKLRTYPIVVSWIKDAQQKAGSKLSAPATFCQAVRMVAIGGWSIGLEPEDLGCKTAQWVFGFREPGGWDTEHHREQYVRTEEEAQRLISAKPRFERGKITGIHISPLSESDSGDVVMLIVDSHQALRLLQAWTFLHQEGTTFTLGSSSLICSFGAVAAYTKDTLIITIPCIGAKTYGLYQDHELICAFPYSRLNEVLEGLEETAKRGHTVPYMPRFALPPSPPAEMLKK